MPSALLAVALSVLLAGSMSGQDPRESETKAVVVLENPRIRVTRYELIGGQRTAMHSHAGNVAVHLAKAAASSTTPSVPFAEFSWSDAGAHFIQNLSDVRSEVIEIEVKDATAASEATPIRAGKPRPTSSSAPLRVEDESHHRVVFENQYVRILDVQLPPGETMMYHTHSQDNVAIRLSQALVQRQTIGEEWKQSETKPGEVNYSQGAKVPYTHRIKNVGTTTMRVLDIELL